MNILRKLFFCFFVIVFLVYVQEEVMGMGEPELSPHTQRFLQLTYNSQDAVNIVDLTQYNPFTYQTPEDIAEHTTVLVVQSAWSSFFTTMRDDYTLDQDLYRAAEQLVFTKSDYNDCRRLIQNSKLLLNFCAVFVYCSMKGMIHPNDIFIDSIKTNTCDLIGNNLASQIPYISTLFDILQSYISQTNNSEQQEVWSLLQYSIFELFMTDAMGDKEILDNLRNNKLSQITTFLRDNNCCSDQQERMAAVYRLPVVLKRLYGNSDSIKKWEDLLKPAEFINFYVEFSKNIQAKLDQTYGKKNVARVKVKKHEIELQQSNLRLNIEKKRRMLYITMTLLALGVTGVGLFLWHKSPWSKK